MAGVDKTTIRLPEELMELLRQEADRRGMTITAIVTLALESLL